MDLATKRKVAELEGVLLDYWVGRAFLGRESNMTIGGMPAWNRYDFTGTGLDLGPNVDPDYTDTFEPSNQWRHGGPIIEWERIDLDFPGKADENEEVTATIHDSGEGSSYSVLACQSGPTALIAAMRCFVASKFGDMVEG